MEIARLAISLRRKTLKIIHTSKSILVENEALKEVVCYLPCGLFSFTT